MRDSPTKLLQELRAVQLDPLDPCGNNADLVAMARVDELHRGAFLSQVYEGGFEHFAKERCVLPADAFPYYAAQAPRRPRFRMASRLERIPQSALEAAYAFIDERGPISLQQLELGKVESIDWSGWKGTSRAGRMAVEVLVLQGRVVVCGRSGREKRYDLPHRHLGSHGQSNGCSEDEFDEWSIMERVRAAGLLSEGAGIWWSSIDRRAAVERLLRNGRLIRLRVEGVRAPLLAAAQIADGGWGEELPMRLLGPLDPLLWNRRLVRELFDFDYVWEVYKPAASRRFGWYVMPLLDGERLVGRVEAKRSEDVLSVANVWEEHRGSVDRRRLDALLAHQAWACGMAHMVRPATFERSPKP
ncbi:MAG: hypothetical protein ACI9KE_003098 [Polyangiales bacterium]